MKNSRGFFKKVYPQPAPLTLFGFFSGIAQFTYELEHEHVRKLSFVDVLVIRQSNNKFETTVYHKKNKYQHLFKLVVTSAKYLEKKNRPTEIFLLPQLTYLVKEIIVQQKHHY